MFFTSASRAAPRVTSQTSGLGTPLHLWKRAHPTGARKKRTAFLLLFTTILLQFTGLDRGTLGLFGRPCVFSGAQKNGQHSLSFYQVLKAFSKHSWAFRGPGFRSNDARRRVVVTLLPVGVWRVPSMAGGHKRAWLPLIIVAIPGPPRAINLGSSTA